METDWRDLQEEADSYDQNHILYGLVVQLEKMNELLFSLNDTLINIQKRLP